MKKELIAQKDPKAPISEIFRTLRTNIQFMNTKGKLRTILITSTFPSEGKSWISSNLAVTFAQAGKKVILIDADMRKGRQYSIFGVLPRPGLSNYLSGVELESNENIDLAKCIQETEVENLYLIPAGSIPPNPSELLSSPQMVDLLEKLKEVFDIVMIDGTPSQLVTDSLILTRLVDSTIIVTASNETKKEDLKRVITNIKNVGGHISGVVVNKIILSTKKYEQSYYYGSTAFDLKQNQDMHNRKKIKSDNIKSIDLDKVKKIENQADTLQRKIKIENENEISSEKTTDILNQINQYLEEEKKKLK